MPTAIKKTAKATAKKTPAKKATRSTTTPPPAPAKRSKPPAPAKTSRAVVPAKPAKVTKIKTDDRLVVQSNALIRAAHGLSLPEKRLVALATTKIDSFNLPLPGMSLTAKVTGLEYAKAFKLDRTTAYEQLAESARQLYQRSITFQEPGGQGKKAGAVVRMRWVGQAKYHEGEGWVGLEFWHAVVPHLTGLRAEFTKYRLEQTSALRSVNSWRLLELLQRFATTGWAEYTLNEFCTAMEATAAQRKDYGKIRTQLIEPAVAELTDKTKGGWPSIKVTPIKTNRKVTSIKFKFTPPKG